jgi:hypothetical protein
MSKKFENFGTVLSKSEQRTINGGKVINCYDYPICPPYDELACTICGGVCKYLG